MQNYMVLKKYNIKKEQDFNIYLIILKIPFFKGIFVFINFYMLGVYNMKA